MLGLKLPTDPRWVNLAEKSLAEILTDHAYCEQKAASTCISLIQVFSDKEELIEQVAPIVTEEWGHFRMVLKELKKRNLKLGKQRNDVYVQQLIKMRKAHPAFRMRTRAQINANLHFFETDTSVIGYQVMGAAVNDSWHKIQVWFDGSDIEKTISLQNTSRLKTAIVNNRFVVPSPIAVLVLKPFSCAVLYSH